MRTEDQSSRLTKIVCTLGPATKTLDQLKALAQAGMNVARINLSHGSRNEHTEALAMIRALNEQGYCVASLIDTRGAEIRTGVVIQPLPVEIGQEVVFSSDPQHEDPQGRTVIEVNYDGFGNDVRETDTILLDNGTISFSIVTIAPDGTVVAKAKEAGFIGSRQHINLPGAYIDLPSITKKDWDDIAFGAEQGVDYVALSYIRNAEEISEARSFLKKKKSDMHIITKIETKRAVEENLADIVAVSDGIMIARGDLGTDIPIEELPALQDEIVIRCHDAGKPVIVATHMLESMSMYPLPTRAEVTDVAHAATTGADATMLSGETATGKHPVKCVETMDRILRATETRQSRLYQQLEGTVHNEREARAQAAVTLARSINAHAIVVITKSGRTAREVAKFRPTVPVIGCAATPSVRQKLALVFGVFPVLASFTDDTEATIETGITTAKKEGFLTSGMRVVLISDAPAKHHNVSTIQVREIT